jgi:hypothetical protein
MEAGSRACARFKEEVAKDLAATERYRSLRDSDTIAKRGSNVKGVINVGAIEHGGGNNMLAR